MGRLEVCICGACNIGGTRKAGIPDPYVKVVMGDRKKAHIKYKTKVVSSSLNPVWNEVLTFQVADYDSEQIVFELWNKNVIVDDLMGVYALSLNGLTRGVVSDLRVILTGTGLSSPELHLQVLAVDFGVDPQPSSMVVRSIKEYNAAAVTNPVMTATEMKKVTCADDFDSVQKPSSSEPAMGIPLQAQVAPPPQPLLQPVYNQQPTFVQQAQPYPLQPAPPVMYLQPPPPPPQVVYVQQAQPLPHPIYYQQASPPGSYYGAPQQPYQCMYGPSPI
ncbi:putative c2 domain protein [Leishmania major strain Friedlin]|uniref:C2 domain protein n=1 Tax=Leishmania major TaxID=5664 RepID=Q9BHE7_LEIMA|nr:putative c2 domain protein [Leishmania major strain Friedlin]CAC37220.1 C2 domain protein [Leishmania major]CAG9579233.1 c2_domain_protein_-_putative [Leishmania major strain Friedlin]CAJ08265.1 putative c2 domain protein [Leishmania major strain Friedlin]|eukprot:XP_001685063.1 putative c2 domain protein [Leishmania major strain Friedlin]